MSLRSIAVASALALALASCKKGRGDPCEKQHDCGADLVCFCFDPMAEGSCGEKQTCGTVEEVTSACSSPDNRACAVQGECSSPAAIAVKASGVADCKATEESCKASVNCTRNGLCAAVDGECVATRDADCAASEDCKARGECHAVDRRCSPKTDADCAKTTRCQEAGECKVKDGLCRAIR